jgi:serine/threonine-protein kinase
MRENLDDSRLCSYCGASMGPNAGPANSTAASPEAPTAARRPASSDSASSDSIDQARSAPGTMLAERYRIAGLLGKGGMGEVYRADDLKLRQPVALKFLPQQISLEAQRLDRFLHEVRIARQVSHPNVCRVYDIGEAQGQHFISMEYVDGEDAATMLRRLGRPSKEKALQISRQLCAGLAAAHDKGVLHRDLKPHNVMIDGQGRVRITDFGLAGFVEDFAGREVHAGTPAYMAPEQLSGRGVSVKSDIYSLGLVLCELFTGKRLFEGATREQLRGSRGSVPTSLSTLVDDIDPAVERVILRCLEPDPASRPSSALAVAAALPGGDPLAAALEAGETPSPEMVAAAGEAGGMRPAVAIGCFVLIIGTTLALVPVTRSMSHLRVAPLPKPPAALADRAAEILIRLGHRGSVVDSAFGFESDRDYFKHIEKTDKSVTRWANLASIRPSPVTFWYRQSPRLLVPAPSSDRVTDDDPPPLVSGMASVRLDPQGRLVRLQLVPREHDDQATSSAPSNGADWSTLFAEAQIDSRHLQPTAPRWTPERFCDERAAWEGRFADSANHSIRIEAGAYQARPTFFRIIAPWTGPDHDDAVAQTTGENVASALLVGVLLILVLGGALMARRNLALRRADRAGANRLALACLGILLVSWLLAIDHVADIWNEFRRIVVLAGMALVLVAVVWLWYLALEPYARRRWPQVLISWSRLLAGRFRDPLVGRDMLVGGIAGAAMSFFMAARHWVPKWIGAPPPPPQTWAWSLLLGPRRQIGEYLNCSIVFFALLILVLFLGLTLVLKRQWIAFLAVLVLQLLMELPQVLTGDAPAAAMVIDLLMWSLWWSLILGVMLRFGLLASVFTFFFMGLIQHVAQFGLSGWQSEASWIALIFIVAAAGFGCHTALAGRPLFRDELLEPQR